MSEQSAATVHELNTNVHPAACSCGGARFAGSLTFVRRRHAEHVAAQSAGDRPAPHDRNPSTPQAGLACEGEACIYHNPSDHHMRDWPIARGGERVCKHGIGHPDPDYLAWRMRVTDGKSVAGVHGCDFCCQAPATPTDRLPGAGEERMP